MVAVPQRPARSSTPGPKVKVQPPVKSKLSQRSRSSKAESIASGEEDQENQPSRVNVTGLSKEAFCNNLPVPSWDRKMKELRPEEKPLRLKQYELLEQGKEAFGVQPSQENVEYAKRCLVKARAAARRSFFEGRSPTLSLPQLPSMPRVSLPKMKLPRMPRSSSFTSVAFIFLLIAALFSGSEGPIKHVTSILGSAAKVTEAASEVVGSGADLTTSTLRSMVSITAGTLNLAETAWHGVDLVGLDAKQVRGRITADTEAVLARWLLSEAGGNATGANGQLRQQWSQHLQQVAVQMPFQHFSEEHLNVSSCFTRHEASFKLLRTGYVLLDFSVLTITFSPQWSNPLWEVMAAPMDSQHDQISETVNAFAETLPQMNVTYIDIDAATPTQVSQTLLRMCRQCYLFILNCAAYFLGDLRGVGCLGLLLATMYLSNGRAKVLSMVRQVKEKMAQFLQKLQAIIEGWEIVP